MLTHDLFAVANLLSLILFWMLSTRRGCFLLFQISIFFCRVMLFDIESTALTRCINSVGALILLIWWQEGHLACKKCCTISNLAIPKVSSLEDLYWTQPNLNLTCFCLIVAIQCFDTVLQKNTPVEQKAKIVALSQSCSWDVYLVPDGSCRGYILYNMCSVKMIMCLLQCT